MGGLFHTNRILFLPLLFLVLASLVSCGGSKESGGSFYMKRVGITSADLDKSIAAISPQLVIEQQDDRSFYLGMTASAAGEGSPQMAALNSIRSVGFIVFDADGNLIDSLYTERIGRSGLGGGDASLTASAGTEWRPAPPVPQKLRIVMYMRTSGGVWPKEVITSFDEPLYAEPVVLNLDYAPSGNGLEFVLTAQRVAEAPEGEYLPSSEAFRIEVYNGPTLYWSSSRGKAFAQMIGQVEPSEIGGKAEYRAVWPGVDSTGKAAGKGALTVVATIPAKPNPYTVRKEIQWPTR